MQGHFIDTKYLEMGSIQSQIFMRSLEPDLSNSLTMETCLGMNKTLGIRVKHCEHSESECYANHKSPGQTSPWHESFNKG